MPAYQTTPFKPTPKVMTPGIPAYFWGTWNDKTGNTTGKVISNSAASTTATVTLQIQSGNIPVIGALISIVGSTNSAGIFNVTNAVLLSVSSPANPDEGIYTVTFAISSTTQSTMTDSGIFQIPQSEIGEPLAAGASAPLVQMYNIMSANLSQAVTVVASFPSLPTSVILYLQQALQDLDSEYQTVATIATVSTGAVQGSPQISVDPTLGRFFRVLNGTVVGGTLPTVICKIMI
jgi:hypothetical protein